MSEETPKEVDEFETIRNKAGLEMTIADHLKIGSTPDTDIFHTIFPDISTQRLLRDKDLKKKIMADPKAQVPLVDFLDNEQILGILTQEQKSLAAYTDWAAKQGTEPAQEILGGVQRAVKANIDYLRKIGKLPEGFTG